ncbi:hypothetical protein [Cellulosimicrobium sp. CUA-896]|uniref:hypothetical protein n=1 Tax=Cellulosimicrobium sp. CUA-896 TaxID=1517881 RepID=UPI000964AEBD|nr:hypothetical protein [Cellulosimicrobium sp. CUA-896]OLT50895.1 hypothetical protein BJF88_01840 [Cellulosimicrobium sp. CUA-896]
MGDPEDLDDPRTGPGRPLRLRPSQHRVDPRAVWWVLRGLLPAGARDTVVLGVLAWLRPSSAPTSGRDEDATSCGARPVM